MARRARAWHVHLAEISSLRIPSFLRLMIATLPCPIATLAVPQGLVLLVASSDRHHPVARVENIHQYRIAGMRFRLSKLTQSAHVNEHSRVARQAAAWCQGFLQSTPASQADESPQLAHCNRSSQRAATCNFIFSGSWSTGLHSLYLTL